VASGRYSKRSRRGGISCIDAGENPTLQGCPDWRCDPRRTALVVRAPAQRESGDGHWIRLPQRRCEGDRITAESRYVATRRGLSREGEAFVVAGIPWTGPGDESWHDGDLGPNCVSPGETTRVDLRFVRVRHGRNPWVRPGPSQGCVASNGVGHVAVVSLTL
jgi:hypothetical protein